MADARSDIAHLYRRAGFGLRADELDGMAAAGYEAAVERLLTPGPDAGADAVAVPDLTLTLPGPGADPATLRAAFSRKSERETALVLWWLQRMLAARNPLIEKLTLFWHGHFATSLQKVYQPGLMFDQNVLLRRLGWGPFDKLTQAVAKDPAMLIWLDAAKNKKGRPNENFARELMELFTLGLGHYGESDVKEVARCFTGWRLDPTTTTFALDPAQHDQGKKTVLGQTGNFDADDVVDILTHSPTSVRFVAARLWSHFARPATPDDPVVDDLVAAAGPVASARDLLGSIFLHPEFRSTATRTGLVKTPVEWVVGALRALGVPAADPRLIGVLRDLGQIPFRPPSVGGWPQNGYWLSTASSLARLEFARDVVTRADLTLVEATPVRERLDAVGRLLAIDGWRPATAAALEPVAGDPPTLVALALVAPDYVLA